MLKRTCRWVCAAIIAAGIAGPVAADEGLWLFTNPPVKLLEAEYGFEPTSKWLEHVQRSAVRLNTGGSASFVSTDGLVMTNHHVGAPALERLSTPEHNLLATGFYARTREEERPCPGLEANVLWHVEDVTERVADAVTPDLSAADANTARRKMISTIEKEYEDATGLDCQVVTLYEGAQYHLYQYKRFTDIRLVMAPEQAIAFFGGDTDNFEYPRYDLDLCLFRVYVDGKPYKTEHYLSCSQEGASDGDLVFVVGHPGRTHRLITVDHLKFMRDVELPQTMRGLWRREVQLQTFSARNAEFARIANNELVGVQNSRKAHGAILTGMQDPAVMNKKLADEAKLRAVVDADPTYKNQWGEAWDQVAAARAAYRGFYLRHHTAVHSTLFGIATRLVELAEEKEKPSAERLPEYSDANLDSLYLWLFSPGPIYDELEIDRISSSLSYLMELFGGDDPYTLRALGGLSPRERAESLVHGTRLKDIDVRKELAEGGTKAIGASTDPMIRLAAELDPDARMWRTKYEDEVESGEKDAYAKVAAAQFAVNGEEVYPDATFTLRLAFGTVKGYNDGRRSVRPFTTFEGLYKRAAEREGQEGFDLPQRWWDRKDALDLDTPYNFICTADTAAGNSGSPVVNREGEVVGLIFDVNTPCLMNYLAYTEGQGRAIAVDTRAITEALEKVYDAEPLVKELAGR